MRVRSDASPPEATVTRTGTSVSVASTLEKKRVRQVSQ